MTGKYDDIRDDELRVVGRTSAEAGTPAAKGMLSPEKAGWKKLSGRTKAVICIAVLAVVAGILILAVHGGPSGGGQSEDVAEVFDPSAAEGLHAKDIGPVEPLGAADGPSVPYTETLQRCINDITLSIYLPHNATPTLRIGEPPVDDRSIVLAAQAADIRADNGKINGAFVLEGTPLAWGLSKKGYVAIIDGKVTVGVADDSPLFERATETGGCFFRQYPLVDNGMIVENQPKGKSVRKAICTRAGQTLVVVSDTAESFHDFAQALADFGVDNAVYLVGSATSYGFWRDAEGTLTLFNEKNGRQKFENYIIWR